MHEHLPVMRVVRGHAVYGLPYPHAALVIVATLFRQDVAAALSINISVLQKDTYLPNASIFNKKLTHILTK